MWKSSAWWFQTLWKIWKSVGVTIPNMLKNNVPNHQPVQPVTFVSARAPTHTGCAWKERMLKVQFHIPTWGELTLVFPNNHPNCQIYIYIYIYIYTYIYIHIYIYSGFYLKHPSNIKTIGIPQVKYTKNIQNHQPRNHLSSATSGAGSASGTAVSGAVLTVTEDAWDAWDARDDPRLTQWWLGDVGIVGVMAIYIYMIYR